MKKIFLAMALLGGATLPLVLTAPRAIAAAEVQISSFYDSLAPYGDWIDAGDYGYVWQPRDMKPDWRPYTVGSWAYTDAGWTWVSEEDFGPITYHYGRWGVLDNIGWCWFPDTDWAPAWVSWRTSDEYVGWAPLPPEAQTVRETGVSSWADSYYDIGPTNYVFVQTRDLGAPRLNTVILPRQETVTYVRETRNVTNIVYRDRGYFVGGPDYEVVRVRTAQPVRRLRLERREDIEFRPGERLGGFRPSITGDALRVFAPAIIATGGSEAFRPARISRKVETVHIEHGWKGVPEAARTQIQQTAVRAPSTLPSQPKYSRAAAFAPKPTAAALPLTGGAAAGAERAARANAAEGSGKSNGNTPEATAAGNPRGERPNGAAGEGRPGRGEAGNMTTGRNTPAEGGPTAARTPATGENATATAGATPPAGGKNRGPVPPNVRPNPNATNPTATRTPRGPEEGRPARPGGNTPTAESGATPSAREPGAAGGRRGGPAGAPGADRAAGAPDATARPGRNATREPNASAEGSTPRGPSAEATTPRGPKQESVIPRGPSAEGSAPRGPAAESAAPRGPKPESVAPKAGREGVGERPPGAAAAEGRPGGPASARSERSAPERPAGAERPGGAERPAGGPGGAATRPGGAPAGASAAAHGNGKGGGKPEGKEKDDKQ